MRARLRGNVAWAAAAAFVGFAFISALVAIGATRQLDRAILDSLQPITTPWLDLVSSLLSAVGGVAVTSTAALLLTVWWVARRGLAGLTPLLMFIGSGIEVILKRFIDHPPPPVDLLRDAHWLAIGGLGEGGSAFPSGHLVRTTFLAIVLVGQWPKLRPVAVALVTLMALSRVYSASHWTSDVIGGLCLGAGLGGVAVLIDRRARP